MKDYHMRTVDVEIEDETRTVELTAPTPAEVRYIIATAPNFMTAEIGELFGWGGGVVSLTSDLTVDEAGLLGVGDMMALIMESSEVIVETYGDGGSDGASEFLVRRGAGTSSRSNPFDDFDLDDQGAVDLEDWQ